MVLAGTEMISIPPARLVALPLKEKENKKRDSDNFRL